MKLSAIASSCRKSPLRSSVTHALHPLSTPRPPQFKLEVAWTRGKSEGVKLQFNLGAAGTQEDIDTRPNYTLNWLPAADASAVIQDRLAFLLKGGTTGTWSDWKRFTLTGA